MLYGGPVRLYGSNHWCTVLRDRYGRSHLRSPGKKNEDIILPDVNIGDVLSIENKEIKEKYTQPAKHFTKDLLLKAMELAGNDALEKGAEVERKGLEIPVTRDGIIENLIFKGFIE